MSALSCEAARALAAAFADGELVGEERAHYEMHIGGCEACRRWQRDVELLNAAVAEAWSPPPAPAALRARVAALLRPGLRRAAWRRVVLPAAAVAAAVLAGYAAGRRPPAPARARASEAVPGDLAALAANTHLRYTRGQLPLEIGSEKPEAVSRWFSGRVPFNLALPDYPVGPGEQKFYRLQGGRLISFGGDYAAYIAYRMDDRPISLIVTSAAQARPQGAETVRFRSLVFHQQAVEGLKVVTWSDKGLTYALASDLSVSGEQSCMVCHGSPEQRRLIEGFSRPRS